MADEKTHTVVDDSTTKPVMSNNNLEKNQGYREKKRWRNGYYHPCEKFLCNN